MPDDARARTATPLGGRYRLVREIARGGMATVHLARDETLDREVAVKVLHRHLAEDRVFVDRFLREARAAARLSHPNVVAVYDWGEDDGDSYLVMEHVDGPSLRRVLSERRRLAAAEAAAVLAPAARGIGAAHAQDVVHRDVKPENILIAGDGTVKVTDFGLAKATAATTQTFAPGSLVGSPHYLAPEAVSDEPVGVRADVYALGIVLYEAVVGRPPFEGDSAYGTAMRHATDSVPPPSRAVPVPDALDALVAQATARDPDDRHPDAAAFEAALRAAVPPGDVPEAAPAYHTLVIPPETSETVVPGPRSVRTPPPPRSAEASSAGVVTDPDGDGEPGGSGDDGSDGAATSDITARAVPTPDADVAGPPPGDDTVDDTESRPTAGRWGRRRWTVVVATLAVLAALGGGLALAWHTVIAPVEQIPPVEGATVDDALVTLTEAGFDPAVGDVVPFDPEVEPGIVLAQEPTGQARIGTRVELTVAGEPDEVSVPEVAGMEEDDAVAELAAHDLEAAVETRHDEEVAEGTVIATDPAADSSVLQGDTVTLLVSLGREPIEVPGVQGMTRSDAAATIDSADLQATVVAEVYSDDVAEGHVIGQSPEPGATLHRGDTVELTVSLGPEPFDLPDVRGDQHADAVAMLEDLGLAVEVREVEGPDQVSGEVAEQDPRPGTEVRRGDRVTLYVWE